MHILQRLAPGPFALMAEDDLLEELIHAGNLVKNAGYHRAANILGREGARLIHEKRKPRKKGMWVRVNGHPAFLDAERVRDAEEWE